MKTIKQMLYEAEDERKRSSRNRKAERRKLKGLSNISSKRQRTQRMNRELAAKKRTWWDEHVALCIRPNCEICGLPIRDYEDCEIDHRNPRGMGGGKRDDSISNLRLTHSWCNREKGSRRV